MARRQDQDAGDDDDVQIRTADSGRPCRLEVVPEASTDMRNASLESEGCKADDQWKKIWTKMGENIETEM
jgi:hypothetical protein